MRKQFWFIPKKSSGIRFGLKKARLISNIARHTPSLDWKSEPHRTHLTKLQISNFKFNHKSKPYIYNEYCIPITRVKIEKNPRYLIPQTFSSEINKIKSTGYILFRPFIGKTIVVALQKKSIPILVVAYAAYQCKSPEPAHFDELSYNSYKFFWPKLSLSLVIVSSYQSPFLTVY